MNAKRSALDDRAQALHFGHLPPVCFHGMQDPHRCTKCHLVAKFAAQEQAAIEAKQAEDARRAAIAQQTAADPEIEAFRLFLAAKFPTMTDGARAIAYNSTPALRTEWETTKHARIHQPLF